MAVSRRLRYEILRRDDHACRYCGQRAPDVPLTVDHVIPVALGGTDEPTNLVTACKDCNAGKSSSSPDAPIVENVTDDALRWSRAMAWAAGLQAVERRETKEQIAECDAFWCRWVTQPYVGQGGGPIERPDDWKQTIERFLSLGLDVETITDQMEIALNRPHLASGKCWRYFCGCCYRRLEERQEIARAKLDTEGAT
jgi:hypothetical protein